MSYADQLLEIATELAMDAKDNVADQRSADGRYSGYSSRRPLVTVALLIKEENHRTRDGCYHICGRKSARPNRRPDANLPLASQQAATPIVAELSA
jgi:hypothetical protein